MFCSPQALRVNKTHQNRYNIIYIQNIEMSNSDENVMTEMTWIARILSSTYQELNNLFGGAHDHHFAQVDVYGAYPSRASKIFQGSMCHQSGS